MLIGFVEREPRVHNGFTLKKKKKAKNNNPILFIDTCMAKTGYKANTECLSILVRTSKRWRCFHESATAWAEQAILQTTARPAPLSAIKRGAKFAIDIKREGNDTGF